MKEMKRREENGKKFLLIILLIWIFNGNKFNQMNEWMRGKEGFLMKLMSTYTHSTFSHLYLHWISHRFYVDIINIGIVLRACLTQNWANETKRFMRIFITIVFLFLVFFFLAIEIYIDIIIISFLVVVVVGIMYNTLISLPIFFFLCLLH